MEKTVINLNLFMQHWTRVKITEYKPPARSSHAACCITGPLTGQQHPLLMVVGGLDANYKPLDDVWLLDVDKGVWSEVGIPYTARKTWLFQPWVGSSQ